MKKIICISLIILSFAVINFGQENLFNTDSVTTSNILKPTLKVSCVRDLNYWKQPEAKNFWSWMPKLQFAVSGPIDDASYLTYEFFGTDGKLWFTQDSAPFSVAQGNFKYLESEAVPRWTDKRSIISIGVFNFKITLKNPLQGTSKLLYQGKFNVKKEFAGTSHPDFKNQFVYYVDQDWSLPMAYLNFSAKQDTNAPIFNATQWFRGMNSGKLKAYLFYNGKQVSNTEVGGSWQTNYVISEGDDANKYRWEQWTFSFYNARMFDKLGDNKTYHVFNKNPGNYELKVILDGELVRIVPFTVGSDGNIVDNGVAKNNGISGFGYIVPAKVIPTKEGSVNLSAYKTEAFYGNILTGF